MIGMVTKEMFFDRKAVARRVDRAARRVFSRFGAYVRTTAKHSIRKRKRVSRPGEPPSSHTGLLRRFIFFGYDRDRRSVVIGPMPLTGRIGDAPHALEYGGPSAVRGRRGRKRRVRIAARPYMRPAFENEQPKLPAMWAGSVK
jgi:phage gpG-like protein